MQINRLFEIVYLLLDKPIITAAELADRFEVSTRTIYRDIDTLSGAGIPVYTLKGKKGGIALLPEFVMNKSLLSDKDQNEILFALQSLKATNAEVDGPVLDRLSGLFQKGQMDWIDVDFSRWGSGSSERRLFSVLKQGILEARVVSFNYYGSDGTCRARQIEPAKLRFKYGSWYIQGICCDKKEYRTFKITRMEDASLTDRHFERTSSPPDLDGYVTDENKHADEKGGRKHSGYVTVRLKFAAYMGFRVFDEFGRENIEAAKDGSLLVTVETGWDDWFTGYLLTYGDEIEILSPEWARQDFRELAARIADKNS